MKNKVGTLVVLVCAVVGMVYLGNSLSHLFEKKEKPASVAEESKHHGSRVDGAVPEKYGQDEYSEYDYVNDYLVFETLEEQAEYLDSLGLGSSSIDMRHLVDGSSLDFSAVEGVTNDLSTLVPEKEWIFKVADPSGESLDAELLDSLIYSDLFYTYPFYPYEFDQHSLTWVAEGYSEPERSMDTLMVSLDLAECFAGEEPSGSQLREIKDALFAEVQGMGWEIESDESIASALNRSRQLRSWLVEFNDAESLIQMGLFQGTKMRDLWDALISMGFAWDGGVFRLWSGPEGGTQWMTVMVALVPDRQSEEVGYIDPRKVAGGQTTDGILLFWMGPPIVPDPVGAFRISYEAASYCQQRLNGNLMNGEGKPFVYSKEEKKVIKLQQDMKEAGLQPGSDLCLQLFYN